MVDPMYKDTKNIKDQSMGTEGYQKKRKKAKVNQLDGGGTRKTNTIITKPRSEWSTKSKDNRIELQGTKTEKQMGHKW